MTSRFKFIGHRMLKASRIATTDAGEFNESDHPRAENGQFTSGGGVSGKQHHGGVTAPKKGTASHTIWSLAAELQEQKKVPTAKAVAELAASKGHSLNAATIGVQLGNYKKYQAGAKSENGPKPAEAPAKKGPMSASEFKAIAEGHGLEKEGTYGG